MGKMKMLLLAAAFMFIGSAALAQSQLKPECSYQGKSYADGTTNSIGQVCVAGAWQTASQAQIMKQCFYVGRAFSDGSSNAEGKVCDGQTGNWR